MRRRLAWAVLAFVVAAVFLAVAALWTLSSPSLADACVPGFERCLQEAEGIAGQLDCRVEVYHCRIDGPSHWERGHE